MLNKLLSLLDLSEDESLTYSTLLETGPQTVGVLAKKLGKPRPSLYGFLNRLQEKGIVSESSLNSVRTYIAQPPEKLDQLFKDRLELIETARKEYQELMPHLKRSFEAQFSSPKFQLFQGEQGIQHILKDMLLYRNIETEAFWPIKSMVEALPEDFFRLLNKERIRRNIYTRAIWPVKQVVSIKRHPYLGVGESFVREIRIAPEEVDFSMGYWIYANKVAFISSKKERFGFIIESKDFVEMQKAQFEVMWRLSKKLKVDEKDTQAFLQEL